MITFLIFLSTNFFFSLLFSAIIKKDYKIFIATNNKNLINLSKLKEFNTYNKNYDINSFIEQYICSKSRIFIFSNNNNYNKEDIHSRSTWSSFVIDYRNYFLNKKNDSNINIIKILKLNKNLI